MIKNYFYTIILFCLVSITASAQDSRLQQGETLGFYPNPVNNGKIFITSKTNLDKEILIFDVLGKKVFQTVTSSKEVNINAIQSGVYIIKITEGENTTTRKLIVR